MMIWFGDRVPGVWAIDIWASGYALFSERGHVAQVRLTARFSSAPEGSYQYSGHVGASAAAVPPVRRGGHPDAVLRVVPLAVREHACP